MGSVSEVVFVVVCFVVFILSDFVFMGVDRFGAMLDICLMVWESLWDGFGIVLGPFGNRFGISLRSPWDRFGHAVALSIYLCRC